MGMHAMDAMNMCIDHEAEWDNYFAGYMSDEAAYDAGIIDSQGYADSAQMQRVINRNPIGTLDEINNQLSHAVKDLQIGSHEHSSRIYHEYCERNNHRGDKQTVLNNAALANLRKPSPTCNECGEQMPPRDGKYGKFYFCASGCKSQKCVSDKYWQSVRK